MVSRSFKEIAAAFLNQTSKKTSAQISPARRSAQPMWASSSEGKPSVEPRAGRVGVYCHLSHMQRELVRPFKVSPATVKRNQLHFGQSVSEWYNALPRAAKGSRGQLKEQVSCCHSKVWTCGSSCNASCRCTFRLSSRCRVLQVLWLTKA